MIEISHLTKKYGDHTAVDDLNLTIEPGRIYGFLGPNGAGKSTTMNMITGYLAATEGTVTIDGHDIYKEANKAKSHIGYLPEIPPLYPDMTVLEYLTFAAELKKIPKDKREQEVDDACITSGISDVAGRLIRNLSKGYKQRVGIAQAILGKPDIVILDEPTAGLDPAQIIEVRDLIRELGKEHTVILSSHILSEISEICNYVFIISKGKLVASDETENLLSHVNGSQEIEITVTVENDTPDVSHIQSVFDGLEDVDHTEMKESSEEGTVFLKIFALPDKDIRADVFKCAASNGLILLSLNSRSRSLEDVFLELTQTDEAYEEGGDEE
ncbi:MAG: ABC transporter ATP-binding protein [Lachnospiraceae bacterium]|nr:ABC transporter ATP-binding protein [Lachnospiraceae bacterium]